MTKPLRTCPDCGAYLDSGERCDCKAEPAQETDADPQATENPHGPVLTAGA